MKHTSPQEPEAAIGGRAVQVGDAFSRLTVVDANCERDQRSKKLKSRVRCKCGVLKVVLNDNLKSGGTRSCGCLRRENGRSPAQLEALNKARAKQAKRRKGRVMSQVDGISIPPMLDDWDLPWQGEEYWSVAR